MRCPGLFLNLKQCMGFERAHRLIQAELCPLTKVARFRLPKIVALLNNSVIVSMSE